MKIFFILACSCLFLTACGNGSKTNKKATTDTIATDTIDIHHAENSLDYAGTYTGTFPAADCPGIETTLILNNNKTFTQHYSYLERNTSFDEKGTYTLNGNLLVLKENENGAISYYKIEESKLRKLDGDKQEIPGEIGEHYVLNKK